MKKWRNKITGEINEFMVHKRIEDSEDGNPVYAPFDGDIDEWEDVPEEPKEYWYISDFGYVFNHEINNKSVKSTIEEMKSIGNYFSSREEAEKAVEKLEALKRLRDKGFRFTLTPGVGSLDITPGKFQIVINADMPAEWFCCDAVQKDLDDCFGGEE